MEVCIEVETVESETYVEDVTLSDEDYEFIKWKMDMLYSSLIGRSSISQSFAYKYPEFECVMQVAERENIGSMWIKDDELLLGVYEPLSSDLNQCCLYNKKLKPKSLLFA